MKHMEPRSRSRFLQQCIDEGLQAPEPYFRDARRLKCVTAAPPGAHSTVSISTQTSEQSLRLRNVIISSSFALHLHLHLLVVEDHKNGFLYSLYAFHDRFPPLWFSLSTPKIFPNLPVFPLSFHATSAVCLSLSVSLIQVPNLGLHRQLSAAHSAAQNRQTEQSREEARRGGHTYECTLCEGE